MSEWPRKLEIEWTPRYNAPPGECYVEEGGTYLAEFESYGLAGAFIADMHDRQENLGLPLSAYSVIPVRSTPGGVDRR